MKILWLCNVAVPKVAKAAGLGNVPYAGWLVRMADSVMSDPSAQLCICFPQSKSRNTLEGEVDGCRYYGLNEPPHRSHCYHAQWEAEMERILRAYQPDLIHIWGTEYPRSLATINAANRCRLPVVVSIQGLCSIYAKHYFHGLGLWVRIRFTLRDLLRRDNLLIQYRNFCRQGEWEEKALAQATHVIGRTSWDLACTKQLAPKAQYHFCNETLRPSFYEAQWQLENCQRYSLFVSQSSYPIKGFHQVLAALPEVLKRYPETMLYTTGADPRTMPFYRRTSYQKHLVALIRKYQLEKHVVFTGVLNEEEMCQRYLRSHVFVSAASIENSPNSVGEAMLLGMPIVASYVGGTMDLLKDRQEGYLYQADAPYMMAHCIMQLFDNDAEACRMGQAARQHALRTHDADENLKRLMEIYRETGLAKENVAAMEGKQTM